MKPFYVTCFPKKNLASEKPPLVNGDAKFKRDQKVRMTRHSCSTFFEVGLIRHTLKNDLLVAGGWFPVKNNKTILFLCSPSTEASNFAVVVGRGKRRNLGQNNRSRPQAKYGHSAVVETFRNVNFIIHLKNEQPAKPLRHSMKKDWLVHRDPYNLSNPYIIL